MRRIFVIFSSWPLDVRTKLAAIACEIRENTSGAAMVEYSVLIAIICALTIALVVGVGHFVNSAWSALCSNLQGQVAGINCS